MSLFLISPQNIFGEIAKLSETESHHLIHVLRKKIGDLLTLIDGHGLILKGKIISTDKEVKVKILETEKTKEVPPLFILCQALLKNPRMDWLIEKATELGVTAILPWTSERGVIKIDPEKEKANKIQRWERIATAALKQSGRSFIPEIGPFLTFKELLKKFEGENILKLLFHPSENSKSISELMGDPAKHPFCLILIGPEGGFTNQEIKIALDRNFHLVSLGNSILRAETASLKALSILNFLKEIPLL